MNRFAALFLIVATGCASRSAPQDEAYVYGDEGTDDRADGASRGPGELIVSRVNACRVTADDSGEPRAVDVLEAELDCIDDAIARAQWTIDWRIQQTYFNEEFQPLSLVRGLFKEQLESTDSLCERVTMLSAGLPDSSTAAYRVLLDCQIAGRVDIANAIAAHAFGADVPAFYDDAYYAVLPDACHEIENRAARAETDEESNAIAIEYNECAKQAVVDLGRSLEQSSGVRLPEGAVPTDVLAQFSIDSNEAACLFFDRAKQYRALRTSNDERTEAENSGLLTLACENLFSLRQYAALYASAPTE